ncbi:MAG: DUF1564 family protein [Spirochaetales bacterium]|nr:DUF1564 family protein [Leptospiraceae bacterium]MCP5481567.1 DUF1564 family protein [Spirochaetales bacterium]MCP5484395.1 DUF1564 family protein [Spirochaetales bacterium]
MKTITEPHRPQFARCKILIPERHLEALQTRLRIRGLALSRYLPELLRLARRRAAALPCRARYTTFYQAPGQELQPVNFAVPGQLWGEFKLIARGCGVSNCYLFVFLMLLDATDGSNMGKDIEDSNSRPMRMAEIVDKPGISLVRRFEVVARLPFTPD